jgi:hypothetical protein
MNRQDKRVITWRGYRSKARRWVALVTGAGISVSALLVGAWTLFDRSCARPYVVAVADERFRANHKRFDLTVQRLVESDSTRALRETWVKCLIEQMATERQRALAERRYADEIGHWRR